MIFLVPWSVDSSFPPGNLTDMWYIDLDSNHLVSTIPSQLGLLHGNLSNVYLFNNSLTGPIPTELGQLTLVNDLELFDNSLSGRIPSALGQLTLLDFLFLFDNHLSGPLPSEIGDVCIDQRSYVINA